MSGAVDEHFKANRDWLAQSFVYALAETAVMLSLAFLVVGTSNFVSGRFLGFQTWFAACMLLAWMMWFVMPQIPLEVCSFAPQVPSGRVWLFVVGIAGVAVFCWLGNVLSMENLKVGDGVSWLRASHYALALPLQEELLFRGIVFLGLLKRAPSRRRLCVALSGVSFAVMHLPNTEVSVEYRVAQALYSVLGGCCYAVAILRSRSFFDAFWLHAANNALAMFVPVSVVSERILSIAFPLAAVCALHILVMIV